ncbi:MAG: SMP-30/gluconolactonase/LRE family protein [Planctomycetota bacterium]|nr:SMP-30/gluconolactonase/LRE family protein [Planctomycetota bacterium]
MELEILADYSCKCGENPLWHKTEKKLYWTDIETGRLFRLDPATGKHEQIYYGPRVGGFTFQADGSLLLFRDKGNIVLWRDGKEIKTIVKEIPAEAEGRFNDVIADPEGRVFAGTLTDTGKPGRLYRLDRDGKLTLIVDGVGCCNGMAFTADLKKMYFTDSMKFVIYVFDYDRKTGALTNQRDFINTPKDGGYPDGMTIDGKGDIWSARWDGNCVVQYSADGKEKGKITFPVKKVSSVIFGGPNLDEMYLTTAGGEKKNEDGQAAGALYRVKAGVKGVPEFDSRIGM